MRNDLKQYTADALMALAILASAAVAERSWTKRARVVLVLASIVGAAMSSTSILVSLSVFGGLSIVALAKREWLQLRQTLVSGLIAGLGIGLILVIFVYPRGAEPSPHFLLVEILLDWFGGVGIEDNLDTNE